MGHPNYAGFEVRKLNTFPMGFLTLYRKGKHDDCRIVLLIGGSLEAFYAIRHVRTDY